MDSQKKLRDSLKENSFQGKRSIWHSKAYHRFFEGYSETAVPKPNGRGFTIQRVYTGNLYRQDLAQEKRVLLRILYLALFVIVVYLFVTNAIMPRPGNSTWYVVLCQAVSIPFLFWILISFITYLPSLEDLTIHDYRSSSLSFKKATLGASIGLGLAAFATLLFILLNPAEDLQIELVSVAKYLAAALIVFSMNWIERRIIYLIIPASNTHQQS